MTDPQRKYRQVAYMLVLAAVVLFDWYVRDAGFAGFMVASIAFTLLYFDRNWERKGIFSSPFDRDEWFGR